MQQPPQFEVPEQPNLHILNNEGKGGEKKTFKRKVNVKKRKLDYRGSGTIITRSKSTSQASKLLGNILQLAKEALEMGEL